MARRLTVRRAILVAVLLGLLLPSLVVGLISAQRFHAEAVQERAHDKLRQYSELLALGLREPLWSFNAAAARQLIDAIMQSPDVYRVEVRDSGLGVFAERELAERRTGKHFAADTPIVFEERTLGTVRIEISDALVQRDLRARLITLALTLLAQLLLAFLLITFVLERRLVRPLGRVGADAARLAAGNLDTEILAGSDDEIGTLESRLESTRRALKRLVADIEDKNQALEDDLVERQHAEAAAQRSEARIRSLLAQSPLAIIEIGLDGAVQDWNLAAERLFGWTRDEALGRPIRAVVDAVEGDTLQQLFTVVAEGSGGWRSIGAHRTRTGQSIVCQWYNNLVRDADGIPERIVAMVEDVTERQRIEQEIRLLARVVSRTTNNVIIFDPAGLITWCNEAFERATGWTANEARGQPISALLSGPQTSAETVARLTGAIAAAEPITDVEIVYYTRDGRAYWARIEIQPIRDDSGQVLQFMEVQTDVTERKLAEQRIRESRRMLRNVLDAVPVGLFWKDRHSNYLGGNARFAQDARVSPDNIPGLTDAALWWRAEALTLLADDREVIERGQPLEHRERQRVSPEGVVQWLRTTTVPLRDDAERIIGVLGVYEDITDRKAAELALGRSERRMQALIDHTPDATLEFQLDQDRGLVLTTANPAADRLFKLAAVSGTTFEAGLAGLRDTPLPAALVRVAHGGGRYILPELTMTVDNEEQYFEVTAFQTAPDRVAVQLRELSDMRRATEGLRRLAQSGDTESDPDYYRRLLTHFARAVRARSASLLIGDPDTPEALHTCGDSVEDQHALDALARRCRAGGAQWALSTEHTPPQTLVSVPLRHGDGEPGGALSALIAHPVDASGLVQSLAEVFALRATAELGRQRTLRALRESESRFSLAFHEAPVAMTLANMTEGRFIDVNRAFVELFGRARDELLGRTSLEVGMVDTPEERAPWTAQLAIAGEVSDYPLSLRAADGHRLHTRIWARVLTHGETPTVLVNIIDVTEHLRVQRELEELNSTLEARVNDRTRDLEATLNSLRLAQDQLVRSEKLAALGGLVAGVAHELNTPIGNSLMVASTLRETTTEVGREVDTGLKRSSLLNYLAEADTATDILLRNLQRASELIASFKKVAVDRTGSQRRMFDLREVTGEILVTLTPSLRKTPFHVINAMPGGIALDSFPGPYGQVLTNLITNALIHAFEGRESGHIRLEASAPDDHTVIVSVADDGVGIPPDNLRRIFDPFFTTRRGRDGSGLGLHIVHTIVTEVLGGQIAVESRPGSGTCFRLTLPRHAPDAPEDPTAEEA